MTKTSVSASWSLTSMAMTSWAILSSAARAATRASMRARDVAVTKLLEGSGGEGRAGQGRRGIEVVLVDVLDDPVGDEVPDGPTLGDAGATVGRADRHGRHLLQRDPLGGQAVVAQLVPGARHPDEVRQLPELVDVLPREDL